MKIMPFMIAISGKKQLNGKIFHYKEGQIAYDNGIESDETIVFISGLGDSLLSLDIIFDLDIFCRENNFNLIIPQLTSQPNFRIVSIDTDIEDIHLLLNHIKGKIILIGHSTGCQDLILYLKKYSNVQIKGLVLQAPVSDIECLSDEEKEKNKDIIQALQKNSSLFFETSKKIWLKERFLSLYSKYGKEDLFSSYLDDSHFQSMKFKTIRTLVVLSGNDEYTKINLSLKFELMGQVHTIIGADHSISSASKRKEFIEILALFIKEVYN